MNTEQLFDLTNQELVAIDGGYYPPEKEPSNPWDIKIIFGPIIYW